MTALERYVRRVADELHMKDWDLTILNEHPYGESGAACILLENPYGSHAQLYFEPKAWQAASLERRRVRVVHELVHAIIEAAVRMELTGTEVVVARLTRIIAPTLPLPPKNARPPKAAKP